jgi:hypothetical protein
MLTTLKKIFFHSKIFTKIPFFQRILFENLLYLPVPVFIKSMAFDFFQIWRKFTAYGRAEAGTGTGSDFFLFEIGSGLTEPDPPKHAIQFRL